MPLQGLWARAIGPDKCRAGLQKIEPKRPYLWRGHNLVTGRDAIGGKGGEPAMTRACVRASALPTMAGTKRCSSTAAENSPPASKAARIAAACSSVTLNMRRAWAPVELMRK
jgi:hypothetical protein